jgi:NADH dehydrogenase
VHVPTALVLRSLKLLERVAGQRAFATADEAELMEVALVSERGIQDAERLGVQPRPMSAVLGVG